MVENKNYQDCQYSGGVEKYTKKCFLWNFRLQVENIGCFEQF